ncbi:tRNA (adenosine(37)-N6)-threonylcarbamoyltransferase complex ATPase subunit type 1 TsaE [Marinobacterium weihaiense]|uniref:tRNA (Adenosine(37)-N6)-threonylcarbamoyltransferase complex ATPase subunit type 1 TsaE n=1 Tax=Marinobacterium weihaiense TaxID=2851016 RepID=A0ABS6MCS2_9GAMM|nr:tRNA (adenosine(37)-N6)-threonylcarbamoyltransferase complex ATPase subunit type 1 TsaE [Marinobacterium weihaiense]MBV0934101.1 tRNA (adenosine(37)-N6)-threonylcarbamoyltransferase complex ATPase subunit type 1 TsaE [Marinobacterium weihaiense]
MKQILPDEQAMAVFGAQLAQALRGGGVVFLVGDLGMGKTTLSRGILRGCGHAGSVKSPTYTLVEPYETPQGPVFHFDLYRLSDPEELEYLGIRDYFTEKSLCLVEWPDKGAGMLPAADMEIRLSLHGQGRELTLTAQTPKGQVMVDRLKDCLAVTAEGT